MTVGMVRGLMAGASTLVLLFAAFLGVLFAIPSLRPNIQRAMVDNGFAADDLVLYGVVVVGGIGAYGIVTLALALLVRRRSLLVYVLLVAFQTANLIASVYGLTTGMPSLVPVIYSGVLLGLLLNKPSLAYYRGADRR